MANPKNLRPAKKTLRARELEVGITDEAVVLQFHQTDDLPIRAFLPPDMARDIAAELTKGAEMVEQAKKAEES